MVDRRSFLRSLTGAGAVVVGLPFFEGVLDSKGEALAAEFGGGRLPVRFGTWFWGCGIIPDRWVPETTGAGFALPSQLAPLARLAGKINVLSGFDVPLDGRSNNPHYSGNIGIRTGIPVTEWQAIEAPTIDVLIAAEIGNRTPLRSLQMSADGNPLTSYSYASGTALNASVPTPLELYAKVFGLDFRDPNAADFKPDPLVMARRSVLSSVSEQRKALLSSLGAQDRARADQYFTAIRSLENKLAMQLERPEPAQACRVPQKPADIAPGTDVDERKRSHCMMAELLGMALACNQTSVFNMVFATAFSDLRRVGTATGYHQATHEELVDRDRGYQVTVDGFVMQNMEALAEFLAVLDSIPEGAGTLLDNTLVLAHSDVSYAKNHSVRGLPAVLAGRAGGRLRTGLHIDGAGTPVSQIGLTVQQAMGLAVSEWGTQSMRTDRTISELMAG